MTRPLTRLSHVVTMVTAMATLICAASFPAALGAQPFAPEPSVTRRPAVDSIADASCVALASWDHGVVCGASSRREEYVGGLLVGAGMGALMGAPAGILFRGECNRGVGSAALRGAAAGMVVTTTALTFLARVPRAELERRRAAERDAVKRSGARRVWTAVRPVLTMLGTAAAGGALIGAVDGATTDTRCGDAAGAGALRGAGVYASGAAGLAGVAGLMLLAR